MSHRFTTFVATLALALLGACGGDARAPDAPGASTAEMTKAQMIKDLRGMAGHLEAGAHEELMSYVVLRPGTKVEEAMPGIAKGIKRELSIEGIDIMEANAAFGKLTELFPEGGARWAARVEVNPEECYVLKHEDAAVAAHWNGSRFLYLRIDDVAKLK